MPSTVKLLGSRERGMAVIAPTEGAVVDALRMIDKLMKEPPVKVKLEKWISEARDTSVRRIQGGRIEIFLSATGKSSSAFDTIIGERLPPAAKVKILEYAEQKAQEDPRLRDGRFRFREFSLIASYGMVDAQVPHIDCTYPNFQFGLAVSDGITGTMFFEAGLDNCVNTTDLLIDHWQKMARVGEGKDPQKHIMAPALVNAIKRDVTVEHLVNSFGDVLLPARHMLYNMQKETNLPTGSLLSLPGGVVHAGPATTGYRSVIFFTGCPEDDPDAIPYSPDTQYTGVLLSGHILSMLWSKPGIGFHERCFLLRRLVQYIEGSTSTNMWGHFDPGPLSDFVGSIEEGLYKQKGLSKEAYIRLVAKGPVIASVAPDVIDLQGYQLVSQPGLHTLWDEEEFYVEIYRRDLDGKVVLRYPSAKNGRQEDEFEGHNAEDKFRLVMKIGYEDALFDGTNGTLLDTEGQKVDIYRGRDVEL